MTRDENTPGQGPESDPEFGDGHNNHRASDPGSSGEQSPSHDPDGYQRGEGHNRGDGDTPKRYHRTSHPEDAPGGFNPGYGAAADGTGGYPQGGYPQGGYPPGSRNAGGPAYSGYEPYPGGGYQGYSPRDDAYTGYGQGTFGQYTGQDEGGTPLESTNGQVNIMRAVRFGFKAVFANPAVWILGTVLVGLLFIILSILLGFMMFAIDPGAAMNNDPLSPANVILNLVISVIAWGIAICVIRGALIETDGRRARLPEFFRPVNVGQTVILLVIITVVGLVVSTLIQGDTSEMVTVNETTGELAVQSAVFTRLLVLFVISGLLSPLYSYWIYYTSDGRENAVGAATHGVADAARNYPKLLLYNILSAVVILIAIPLTLLLGLVIFLPVSVLISAHLYRQMSGGRVPVEYRSRS